MAYSLEVIQEIVVSAAQEELMARFTRVGFSHKADGSVLTEADLAVQEKIAGRLMQRWPETVFLGEEMTVDEQRRILASDRPVWCLDPLDGTRNFSSGIPYFCVSLALFEDGEVTLGLVYDPVRDECFGAQAGQGAFLNGQSLQVAPSGLALKQATALIDFKRLSPELATRLAVEIPYASQRSFGSVALDWCWLAVGRCHLYLHGRSYIWDYAAGHFIFQLAGGHACTLDGENIFTHKMAPRSSVAAIDDRLFQEWIAWLGIDK